MSTEPTKPSEATVLAVDTESVRQPVRQLHAVPDPAERGLSGSVRPRAREAVNPTVNHVVNSAPDTQSENSVLPESVTPEVPDSQTPEIPGSVSTEVPAESDDAASTPDGPSTWSKVAAAVHPPNLRTEVPPTWDQIRWHGQYGEHVAREGWPRHAAIAWSYGVALPIRAAVLYADWIARSFSRTALAVLIYAVLAHLAFLAWLPWPGFLP